MKADLLRRSVSWRETQTQNNEGMSRVESDINSENNASIDREVSTTDQANAIGTPAYHDLIVRQFVAATLFWGILATLAGLLIAHLLVIPKMTGGDALLSFGRLRPIHTNTAILAFLANGLFAAIYYSTQRLCKTRLWSVGLGQLHFWSWQLIIIAALLTLPLGITQGRDFSEMALPINLGILGTWVLFFAFNFFMTLRHRSVSRLYVSLWFYIVTIVTFPLLLAANSWVMPVDWVQSYPWVSGVHDSIMQWCYGHTAVMYLLLMPFLGLLYYIVPLIAGRPIHNHRLAITHFWALVLLLVWAGPHRLHYTAIPEWISSMGMLVGMMLLMPMWGGLVNGWKTLRGGVATFKTSVVYRFLLVALLFYGFSTVESFLLSIRSVNRLAHYSDWTIAHLHSGLMGWNAMLAIGMTYWLLPRICRTPLWSHRIAGLHFWVMLLGTLLTVIPLYVAGFTQSWMWNAMDELGNLVHPDFMESITSVKNMWWIRIIGGMLYLVGFLLLGLNLIMTWFSKSDSTANQATEDAHLHESVFRSEAGKLTPASNSLDNAPVLDTARTLDRLSGLQWHRCWEGSSRRFSAMAILALLLASVFQVVPAFVIRGNVPAIASVKPYTALELAGREIYLKEGCYNCHSQTVRPLVAETKRYGDYSRAGEFVFDFPSQFGHRRIGPDLAREGGKQASLWHWQHLENPTALVSGSIMPAYEHLLDTAIDFDKIGQRIEIARKLGVAYDLQLDAYVQDARDQAERVAADIVSSGGSIQRGDVMTLESQAVALIAYLQRLGVDLNAPVEQQEDEVSDGDSAEETVSQSGQPSELRNFEVAIVE